MLNALVSTFKKLHTLLFDFSAGENNRREVEDILLAVLAESKNDFDFLDSLQRVITRYEGGRKEGDARHMAFLRFMYEHERPGERLAPYRVKAEHLLEDLARIYGDKKTPQVNKGTHNAFEPATKEKTNDV